MSKHAFSILDGSFKISVLSPHKASILFEGFDRRCKEGTCALFTTHLKTFECFANIPNNKDVFHIPVVFYSGNSSKCSFLCCSSSLEGDCHTSFQRLDLLTVSVKTIFSAFYFPSNLFSRRNSLEAFLRRDLRCSCIDRGRCLVTFFLNCLALAANLEIIFLFFILINLTTIAGGWE